MRIITNAYRFWIGLFAMALNVEYPKKRWVLKDKHRGRNRSCFISPCGSVYVVPEEFYQEFVQESP